MSRVLIVLILCKLDEEVLGIHLLGVLVVGRGCQGGVSHTIVLLRVCPVICAAGPIIMTDEPQANRPG